MRLGYGVIECLLYCIVASGTSCFAPLKSNLRIEFIVRSVCSGSVAFPMEPRIIVFFDGFVCFSVVTCKFTPLSF